MKLIMENWRKFLKESPQAEKLYEIFNYSSATQGIELAEMMGETELAEKFKALHQAVALFVEAGLAVEQVGDFKNASESLRGAVKDAMRDVITPSGSSFDTYKEVATKGGVEEYIPDDGWWRDMNSATIWLTNWSMTDEDKAAAWDNIKAWAGMS